MAKPISATPTLCGEEARCFIEAMMERENSPVSGIDKRLNEDIKKNRAFFESVFR